MINLHQRHYYIIYIINIKVKLEKPFIFFSVNRQYQWTLWHALNAQTECFTKRKNTQQNLISSDFYQTIMRYISNNITWNGTYPKIILHTPDINTPDINKYFVPNIGI